nr:hypothetical protein [Alloyangia mangrovi]
MTVLKIIRADGILTVQDMGRPGHLAAGLSRGGAMDRLAVLEAAALLGGKAPLAGLEMAGAGGEFTVTGATRIALTGAPMTATLDGEPLRWNASHPVLPGQILRIGGARAGVYGYLTRRGASPASPGSAAVRRISALPSAARCCAAMRCRSPKIPTPRARRRGSHPSRASMVARSG